MKLLLFSDSHGYTYHMIRAIEHNRDVDMVIHLGDFVRDVEKVRELYKDICFEFVKGNNDWTKEYEVEKLLELMGKRILVTHGHLYNVKSNYNRILQRGSALKADAVFFGHTHRTEEMYKEGVLLLNPGSISLPADTDYPTYCLVEVSWEKIGIKFLSIRPS